MGNMERMGNMENMGSMENKWEVSQKAGQRFGGVYFVKREINTK